MRCAYREFVVGVCCVLFFGTSAASGWRETAIFDMVGAGFSIFGSVYSGISDCCRSRQAASNGLCKPLSKCCWHAKAAWEYRGDCRCCPCGSNAFCKVLRWVGKKVVSPSVMVGTAVVSMVEAAYLLKYMGEVPSATETFFNVLGAVSSIVGIGGTTARVVSDCFSCPGCCCTQDVGTFFESRKIEFDRRKTEDGEIQHALLQ